MRPPPLPLDARTAAKAVAAKLRAEGHVAYFAGGCVRDRLRGDEPDDYDIATDATPARVKEIFRSAKGVGEAFGVMLVRRGGHTIEVATFRSDGEYLDGRRPDSVHFGTAEEDARRRDFTINGLFEDPSTGEILDFVGGRDDLRDGVLRSIGDPAARLAEDRLRALRAVRFAARFSLRIEPETERAIAGLSRALQGVSRERIGHELRRMLADGSRGVAVGDLERLGLDAEVLAEDSRGPDAPLPRVRGLSGAFPPESALAAWLLDRVDGRVHEALTRVDGWRRALVLSNAESDALDRIVEIVGVLGGRAEAAETDPATAPVAPTQPWPARTVAQRKRLAATPEFEAALAILATTDPTRAATIAAEVAELSLTGLAPPRLIDGGDLIRGLGLIPGALFRDLLEGVYDAQLEGRVASRADALRLAAEIHTRLAGGNQAAFGTSNPPPGIC